MDYGFSQHIGFYIQEVSRKTSILLNKALEPYGITYSQFRVLNCLWKRGDLTQKEILAIISVQPSTLTGVIDLLENKGLVKRVGDEKDGRFRRVSLTGLGIALREPTWAAIDVIEEKTTSKMNPEMKTMILDELKKMGYILDHYHEGV